MTERDTELETTTDAEIVPRRDDRPPPGRLGTFAFLGAVAGGVPLPWLPDALERRVRGALAQDTAARHRLSLTREARAVFAEPGGAEGPRGALRHALRFVASKLLIRFGPLGMLPPVRSGLSTFVLGHLFARYLDSFRKERAVRIDVAEAQRVRGAIDHALVRALTGELDSGREALGGSPEDLRDEVTQLVDGVLIATAGVPAWLLRRLNAAFDDVLATGTHG